MKLENLAKNLLPQLDGRALDSIKICAALFMVIDHVNLMWLHETSFPMLLAGRGTFPLFCYAVALQKKNRATKSQGMRIHVKRNHDGFFNHPAQQPLGRAIKRIMEMNQIRFIDFFTYGRRCENRGV